MNLRVILTAVALAFLGGFGGGFLWGVADHRSEDAVKQFGRVQLVSATL